MAQKHQIYGNQSPLNSEHEVAVTDVTDTMVEYRDVESWSFGCPTLGQYHTMDRTKFDAKFPHRVPVEEFS